MRRTVALPPARPAEGSYPSAGLPFYAMAKRAKDGTALVRVGRTRPSIRIVVDVPAHFGPRTR
jgi:hypothetical protein